MVDSKPKDFVDARAYTELCQSGRYRTFPTLRAGWQCIEPRSLRGPTRCFAIPSLNGWRRERARDRGLDSKDHTQRLANSHPTKLIDDLVIASVQEGCDCVLNWRLG